MGDRHKTDIVLVLNPLAFELDAYRQVLMNNIAPDMFHLTVIGLTAGALVFMVVIVMRRNSQFLALRAFIAWPSKAPPLMPEIENVSLSYHSGRETFEHGTNRVLDRVSLQVFESETLGVIDRNGLGKTTMLRFMANILEPKIGWNSRLGGYQSVTRVAFEASVPLHTDMS